MSDQKLNGGGFREWLSVPVDVAEVGARDRLDWETPLQHPAFKHYHRNREKIMIMIISMERTQENDGKWKICHNATCTPSPGSGALPLGCPAPWHNSATYGSDEVGGMKEWFHYHLTTCYGTLLGMAMRMRGWANMWNYGYASHAHVKICMRMSSIQREKTKTKLKMVDRIPCDVCFVNYLNVNQLLQTFKDNTFCIVLLVFRKNSVRYGGGRVPPFPLTFFAKFSRPLNGKH